MSMTDCAKCWETPCVCGNDGYLAVYPNKIRLLRTAPYEARRKMKQALVDLLDQMLDAGDWNSP